MSLEEGLLEEVLKEEETPVAPCGEAPEGGGEGEGDGKDEGGRPLPVPPPPGGTTGGGKGK